MDVLTKLSEKNNNRSQLSTTAIEAEDDDDENNCYDEEFHDEEYDDNEFESIDAELQISPKVHKKSASGPKPKQSPIINSKNDADSPQKVTKFKFPSTNLNKSVSDKESRGKESGAMDIDLEHYMIDKDQQKAGKGNIEGNKQPDTSKEISQLDGVKPSDSTDSEQLKLKYILGYVDSSPGQFQPFIVDFQLIE